MKILFIETYSNIHKNDTKLKVIQIIDSLNIGGAEVLAVNIANELSLKGIESHICVTRKEGPLKSNLSIKVKYLLLNRKKTVDIKAILNLKNYIKKNQIDIIHAHTTSSFIAFCVKFMFPKVKLIWHNHTGEYVSLKGKKLYALKLYSKYINYIISVNNDLDLWSKKVLKHKRGSYIQNFPVFSDLNKKTILFGEKGKRIVCLAGLRAVKDHLNLLEAFLLFKKENPNWTLHIIGKDYNDDYSRQIKTFVKDKSLSNNVFLYGLCTDIKFILSQARIGVLSSKSEGLPLSLLEYGLANLPVLVTNVGECKNVVRSKFGVVDKENSNNFFLSLKKITTSVNLENEIKSNLNDTIHEFYSKDKVVNRLISIYKELC